MTMIAITALSLALAQDAASLEAPRRAFDQCMDRIEAEARSAGLDAAAYEARVNGACARESEALKAALARYDRATGTSAAEAERWATGDIADAKAAAVRRYRLSQR